MAKSNTYGRLFFNAICILTLTVMAYYSCKNSSTDDRKLIEANTSQPKCSHHYVDMAALDSEMAKGSIEAYTTEAANSFVSDHEREFLYYSFVFANKYHHPHAYYNIYYELTANTFLGGDSATQYFALYCLTKAAAMGDLDAIDEIGSLEKSCKCKVRRSLEYLMLFESATGKY